MQKDLNRRRQYMILDENVLRKFINNCPKCLGELRPYSPLPGLPPAKAYCPSCDILRRGSTLPFLCTNCNSTKFYNEDREKMNEIDKLIIDKFRQLYDTKSLFTKGFIYREDLGEEDRNKLLEEIKKLEEKRPKNICWYCGCTKFIHMKSEELYKMEKKGELKIGYKISEEFTPVKHNCKDSDIEFIVKVAKTTYKATCKCGYDEYFLIPEWQQEEIKEIRVLKREDDSVDKITIEDLEMTQKIPIITFNGDKDLLEKVKKVISRYENI